MHVQAGMPTGLVTASTMAYLLGMTEEQLIEETHRLGIPHDGSYRYDPDLVQLWFEDQQMWRGRS
jgi:hypothetical protein